jgi:hypothetical protein
MILARWLREGLGKKAWEVLDLPLTAAWNQKGKNAKNYHMG